MAVKSKAPINDSIKSALDWARARIGEVQRRGGNEPVGNLQGVDFGLPAWASSGQVPINSRPDGSLTPEELDAFLAGGGGWNGAGGVQQGGAFANVPQQEGGADAQGGGFASPQDALASLQSSPVQQPVTSQMQQAYQNVGVAAGSPALSNFDTASPLMQAVGGDQFTLTDDYGKHVFKDQKTMDDYSSRRSKAAKRTDTVVSNNTKLAQIGAIQRRARLGVYDPMTAMVASMKIASGVEGMTGDKLDAEGLPTPEFMEQNPTAAKIAIEVKRMQGELGLGGKSLEAETNLANKKLEIEGKKIDSTTDIANKELDLKKHLGEKEASRLDENVKIQRESLAAQTKIADERAKLDSKIAATQREAMRLENRAKTRELNIKEKQVLIQAQNDAAKLKSDQKMLESQLELHKQQIEKAKIENEDLALTAEDRKMDREFVSKEKYPDAAERLYKREQLIQTNKDHVTAQLANGRVPAYVKSYLDDLYAEGSSLYDKKNNLLTFGRGGNDDVEFKQYAIAQLGNLLGDDRAAVNIFQKYQPGQEQADYGYPKASGLATPRATRTAERITESFKP